MRFAIVGDNKHQKPSKGAKGKCPYCGEILIAKCGSIKAHHWAHPSNSQCAYKENKGEWHIDWQNLFPDDWQEVCLIDPITKEKNMADIKTPNEFVIEFQHSHIKDEEKIAREKFYKDMVWVVDGLNWQKIRSFFTKKFKNVSEIELEKFHIDRYDYETNFSSIWATSSVPVIYDFYDKQSLSERKKWEEYLYICFPYRPFTDFYVVPVKRQDFIKIAREDRLQKMLHGIQRSINKKSQQKQNTINDKKRKRQEHIRRIRESRQKQRLITRQNARPKAKKLRKIFEDINQQNEFVHRLYGDFMITKFKLTKGLNCQFFDDIYNPQYKKFNRNEWIKCDDNVYLCSDDIDIKNCNLRSFKCCPKEGKCLNVYYKNISKDKMFFTGEIGKDGFKSKFSGYPRVVFVDKGSKTISVLCKNFVNDVEQNNFSIIHIVYVDGVYYHYQYYSTHIIDIFLRMVCNNNKIYDSDIKIL